MKKLFAILCALIALTLIAFGCKDKPQETEGYYRLFASHIAPTSAEKTDLFGYTFESFLSRGYVLISTTQEDNTLYGVVDAEENTLLFEPIYADVKMVGDFFLLSPGSDNGGYRVASRKGTILSNTPEEPVIEDIGQGYVSVATGSRSIVYDANGAEALASNLMNADYEYTACGNFMIACDSVKGNYQVFNLHTGEVKLSLYPAAGTTISLYYAGGNDFIAIYDVESDSEGNYDYTMQFGDGSTAHLKQTIYRMTIGVESNHILPIGSFVASLTSRYSFGKTEADREIYPLQDGYFTMGIYNVTDKVADGSIRYVVTDASLNVLAELPDGIRPDTFATDGYFLSGLQSSSVRLYNEKLENVLTFSDGPYHSAVLSDGVIVLCKLINGTPLYSAVDTNGSTLINYKYSYLSAFISGKAIGVRDRKSYLVGKDGSEVYLADNAYPYYWDGYYERTENGRIGLNSYNGTLLIPASYEAVESYTRSGDTVYVAMKIGNAVDVYKLH